MREEGNRRIAILQGEYPVTYQTANCAITLAEAGYDVELFCFNILKEYRFIEFEKLREWSHIRIHDFTPDDPPISSRDNNVARKLTFKQGVKTFLRTTVPPLVTVHTYIRSALWKARDGYGLPKGSEDGFLPKEIVSQALELMAGKNYCCLIGFEKKGLIWAGRLSEELQVPFIYYSAELYTEDYWRLVMEKSIDFKRLRLAECAYHRKAYATIIQDPERARVLFQDNAVSMAKSTIFYVPVSLLGEAYHKRSWFLQEALGIAKDRKIILYYGQIWERRHVLELTRIAQTFPEDWVLVMHGMEYDSAVEKIRALDRGKKVILSLNLVPSDELQKLVASADIGLAFYSDLIQNDRLTAFSSEKMALYMQCGVPVIAFDYPGYQRLAQEERCCVVISNLAELPEAIQKILMSFDEFRRRAHQAFYKHYDFAKNFAQVIEAVGHL